MDMLEEFQELSSWMITFLSECSTLATKNQFLLNRQTMGHCGPFWSKRFGPKQSEIMSRLQLGIPMNYLNL